MILDPFGYSSIENATKDCTLTSQTEALARMISGANVFLSGTAGTGKTYVVEKFLEYASRNRLRVAVTASTGIASTLIGGRTIHSWSGIGVSNSIFIPDGGGFCSDFHHYNKTKRKNIRNTDVLIIDEISMINKPFFDNLNRILKSAKNNNAPFGGMQIIVIGDFMQLSPVGKDEEGKFAFESDSWEEAHFSVCYLDKARRAKDNRLKTLLDAIVREDREVAKPLINELISREPEKDKVYVRLFTTNRNVDEYNQEKQALNPGRKKTYDAYQHSKKGRAPERVLEDNDVTLKIGDIVMCTSNACIDENYIPNGSIGKVREFNSNGVTVFFNSGFLAEISYVEKSFDKNNNPIVVRNDEDRANVAYAVKYIPLKLAYAITVHKSQGQSFDGIVTSLSTIFTEGLGYVALSRARNFDSIVIDGYSESALNVSSRAREITKLMIDEAKKNRQEFISHAKDFEDFYFKKVGVEASEEDSSDPVEVSVPELENVYSAIINGELWNKA